MLQNPCKTLGFKKNMVYKIPPGGEINHIQPVTYGETVRPKNWRNENCINLKRDIDQWRHKFSIVCIVIDDETFQQTFVNQKSEAALRQALM